MRSFLIKTAKHILPRSVFNAVRRMRVGNRVDEVSMVAQLCEKSAPGVMIDVGAHFGSSTKEFLDLGWEVIAYEPDPRNRRVFESNIGTHPRLQLSDCAVSNEERSGVQLFSSDVSTGISGLSPFHVSHIPTARVNVVRLDKDLLRRGISRVDFLKVDVEGFDFFVLQGFDWAEAPRFVLYEFENRKTTPLGYELATSVNFMLKHGYQILFSVWEPITEYGANHLWRGLFVEQPTDVDRSWGNVLCFRNSADRDVCMKVFSHPQ